MDQRDFVRVMVTRDGESLIIDLGRDSPVEAPAESTELGPTLSPRDLAARKTLALFGRAEARDFADVYALAIRYGRDQLLKWAATDDLGFDRGVFADMLGSIVRFTDDELPVEPGETAALRAYFRNWVTELTEAVRVAEEREVHRGNDAQADRG